MGLKQDLPLIAGGLIMLIGATFAVGSIGLPGLGNFDNPINNIWETNLDSDADRYDLRSQFRISATALGDVNVGSFTYQTPPSCNLCLNIGDLPFLSLTGADDVRVTRTLKNQDTGRIILSDTISYESIKGGGEVVVHTNADNLKPGNYVLSVKVVYNPSWIDVTDIDNVKTREFQINVPKVSN